MPTDLHCHVLPDVDDGPATLDDSVDLARALVAGGIDRVIATPHVNVQMPTSSQTMHERVALVRDALRDHDIPLLVEPGAEVAAAQLPELDRDELRALSLGGAGWILLEPPLAAEFPIERAAQELLDEGFGVVLAHPERCALFQRDPRRVRTLVEAGARVQVTSSALTGAFGRRARSLAFDLVRGGLVHNAASDAHNAVRRPPTLLADLESAGLAKHAEAWCETLPQAVLARGI
ncbi:MAG TPA: CpsB/CapC family capsule biosynthesis tyrosine phosphatase [Baekduia sp.]|uniref:tyrosine-protein phosphatase n=1 Tax=Baekduia sp. TaxID=2600305 RepID=UPI002C323D27|nr:CpsB/CapC family capsule biosynthesis tyrosine phosphatase [Baekduia sp.]HMJ34659.1 CpsB/CapC family capsule biosynthesis tyrosine phosphatase [Baekduia sp.]